MWLCCCLLMQLWGSRSNSIASVIKIFFCVAWWWLINNISRTQIKTVNSLSISMLYFQFYYNYVILIYIYLPAVILTDPWHHSCVATGTAEHICTTQSVKRSETFMFLFLAVIYSLVHLAFVRGKPTTNDVQQWSLGLTWIEIHVVQTHQINPHFDTGQ